MLHPVEMQGICRRTILVGAGSPRTRRSVSAELDGPRDWNSLLGKDPQGPQNMGSG